MPASGVVHSGSEPAYKVHTEIVGGTEGVGAGHNTVDHQDSITWSEGRPRTLVMRSMTGTGRA